MGHQETEFLNGGEGNRWFQRNRMKWYSRIKDDPVLNATKFFKPASVLEIGCSNGWRLEQYRIVNTANCVGIDVSDDAIADGRNKFPGITLIKGTASYQSFLRDIDMVIYGFCLYVCDRDNLSSIVSVGDFALKDGGHLIVHDFDPEHPHKVPYHHKDGIFSYKMDYSKLWLANPAYTLVSKTTIPDGTAVWVLKWPEEKLP